MIGTIAAILTTASFLPQAIKVIKTQDTKGISLIMYLMNVTGIFLWFVYGIMIRDGALIGANGVTFVLSSIILICKLKYK